MFYLLELSTRKIYGPMSFADATHMWNYHPFSYILRVVIDERGNDVEKKRT